MVKFAQKLNDKENPAWKVHYINYQELKQLLYDGIAKAPKMFERMDGGLYEGYVKRFDDAFFKILVAELDKVNRFYKDKSREMVVKLMDLKSQIEVPSLDENVKEKSHFWQKFTKRLPTEDKNIHLNQEFRDFYIELVSLAKYQDLNYTGFRKIINKHDKLFGNTFGHMIRIWSRIEEAPFHMSKDIEKMIRETEQIYTIHFQAGSRAKAMKILRVPEQDTLNNWTAFKLGLMVGTFAVLFVVLAVSGILDPLKNQWRIVVRFYRGTAVLTLYLFLLGVNIYVWRRRGINHGYIFELDLSYNLFHHHFWNIAAFFGVLWAISIVIFINSENIGIPVYTSPFVLLLIQIVFLLNPFPFAFWNGRKWLIKVFFRIFTSPFHRVAFADFWMCDQLSSLITIVLDYQYLTCFYCTPGVFEVKDNRALDKRVCITMDDLRCDCDSGRSFYRHLIRVTPSILRAIQCVRRFYDNHLIFPHLVNCIKYILSLLVVLFSALQAMEVSKDYAKTFLVTWIVASIASSIMSYSWDVKMDWGLFERHSDVRFLRRSLLYPAKWFYYSAIVGDFFLRFSWAVALPLTEMKFVNPDIMLTVTTPVEIFRRFVWNCFRLENEQIHNNNAQQVNKLEETTSVTSDSRLEEEEQKDLLKMMDIPDGVTKRRSILIMPRLQSRLSTLSSKFIQDSKTELFTRVNSQVSQSEMKSNDNSSDEKLLIKKSLCRRMKDCLCPCLK